MEQAGVALIAQGSAAYLGDMKSATNATNTFVDSTEKGSHRVSAAGQVIIGGLRQMGTIAVDMFAQAAKATAAFAVDSIDLAGDFEAGMNDFRVAAGKDIDAKGIEQFHDLFLQLGKDLPVSTSDVQQAAIELVKGGIDPATVAAGGLKQSIQFAAAAMKGDLVKAAEISSKIVAGWADVNATAADKADLLTHATDLFTKAANASSTDVEQLARGIFNAQGIAKTAGVSLDDLTTTIAELAGDFSSSAEAGTSLKNMIARLQPTTDPATQAMQGLGLWTEEAGSAFYDAAGNFVGFEQASELLQQSLVGLTKEQQAAALQTIFGNDAMTAAAGLAARGGEGYAAMAASLQNAMGVAEAGATVQAGYNTALENAKGSVEAFQIQAGEHLLPVLSMLLNDVITPGINSLSIFTDAIFGSDEAFAKLSPTMQGVVTTIGTLSDDIQNIIGAFNDAGAGSSEFGESIGLLASDLGLPGELIQDIVFAVQDLVSWFNTAGDETNALGAIITTVTNHWQAVFSTLGTFIPGILKSISAITDDVLGQISTFWKANGDDVMATVTSAMKVISDIYTTVLQIVLTLVGDKLETMATYFHEHGDQIQQVIKGAWDIISGVVTGVLALIQGAVHVTLDLINGDWGAAWGHIQEMSVTFTESLGKVITGFLDIIAAAFGTSLAEIVQLWTDNWNQLVDIATQTDWAAVGESVVSGILEGLRNNWDSLMGWVSDKAADLVNAALEAIGAGSPAKKFMPVGEFAVTGIMKGFSDTWPQLTQLIGGLADDLTSKMQDIGEQMQGVIADSFGATASIDRQIAKNLDKFKDVLPQYQQFTQGALKEAEQQARAFADPAEGAKFFKMRSDQILEYADLQKKLSEAATQDDRERIEAQMLLINAAQSAEISAFNANAQAQNPMLDIANQINEIMKELADPKLKLTDEQLHWVDLLSAAWGGLQQPINTRAQQYANPPASSQQMAAQSTTNYYGPVGPQVQMPVYTNNTPAALQQSWAIMQASMT